MREPHLILQELKLLLRRPCSAGGRELVDHERMPLPDRETESAVRETGWRLTLVDVSGPVQLPQMGSAFDRTELRQVDSVQLDLEATPVQVDNELQEIHVVRADVHEDVTVRESVTAPGGLGGSRLTE